MSKSINPWVSTAVIATTVLGIYLYNVYDNGLPVLCYKDDQQTTKSPGGYLKVISYNWNCRKELFGIDMGPAGWSSTGVELLTAKDQLPRRGTPFGTLITYLKNARTELNKEKPPKVKVVWEKPTLIQIYHSPDSEPSSRGGMRFYGVQFLVDKNL